MFFRSLLIPIAFFQVLPCRGEEFFPAGNSQMNNFAFDGAMDDTVFATDDGFSWVLPLLGNAGVEGCFDGFDLERLAEDPFATVANYCKPAETAKFNNALDTFQTCSRFDLKQVIETIASALLGVVLNCGSYVTQVGNQAMSDPVLMGVGGGDDFDIMLSLPRVPEECVDALLGDNPFGNMMMGANEYPEKELACFADLADSLPSCTLKEWPIPIVGNWLKSVSCLLGGAGEMAEPILNNLILNELEGLSNCLPKEVSKGNCQQALDDCRNVEIPVTSIYAPAPFNAAPLPDSVREVVTNSASPKRHEDTLKRYEQYRQSCIPAEDRVIMERVPGITSQYLGVQTPYQRASSFFPGFLTGAILAGVGFFVFSKMKGTSYVGSETYRNIQLNNDLELSTDSRFT